MKGRPAVIAIAVLGLLGGGAAGVQAAGPGPSRSAASLYEHEDDWWCVAVDTIDFGYCQTDPLPDRLPLPPDRPRPRP